MLVLGLPHAVGAQDREALRGPMAISSDARVMAIGGFEASVEDPTGRTLLLGSGPRDPMSVAVSGDGERVAVGDPSSNRVYVFLHGTSGWREEALLRGPRAGGAFGSAVALSQRGERLIIGAPREHRDAGTAWVLTRSEHRWSIEGELRPSDPEGSGSFGQSVAIDREGSHVLVGAPLARHANGLAVVFARLSTEGRPWSSALELSPPHWAAGGRFGSAVAIAERSVLVGAPLSDRGRGAVFCFELGAQRASARSSGTLRAEPSRRGRFGSHVALARDGTIAVIAAPLDGERSVVRYRRIERGWAFLDAASSSSDYLAVDGEGAFRGAGRPIRSAPRSTVPRPLPEDAFEIALGPSIGGNWTLSEPAPDQGWFDQHTQLGGALELRWVFARTFVIGITTALGYAVSSSGFRPLLAFFWSPPRILEETRISIEPRGALRAELARVTSTALALELGSGPTVGWVLANAAANRMGVGAHLDVRFVASWAEACLGIGLRTRVHLWTSEPGVALDTTLEGFVSIAVASPL